MTNIYPWAPSFCESFVSTGHVANTEDFVSGRGRGSHTSPTIDRVESCRLRDKRVSGL